MTSIFVSTIHQSNKTGQGRINVPRAVTECFDLHKKYKITIEEMD